MDSQARGAGETYGDGDSLTIDNDGDLVDGAEETVFKGLGEDMNGDGRVEVEGHGEGFVVGLRRGDETFKVGN